MIDLHSHILPGIDDGAQDISQSIELLKIAQSDGITRIVMTPHVHPGRFDNNIEIINRAFQLLREAIDNINLSIKLSTAAELHLSPEVIPMIENGQVSFLGKEGDYDILLLELPHNHVPPGTDKFINYMMKQNIRPMIAHPERNRAIIEDQTKLKALKDLGCLTQLTSSSITGLFGEKIKKTSLDILNQGMADIVATDTHDLYHRPPTLSTARETIASIFGEELAWELVKNRPESLSDSKFH